MIYTHARKAALRNVPPVISSQSTQCTALIWFVEFTSLLQTIISYVLQQEIYGSEHDFHSILAFWRSVKPFRLVNFTVLTVISTRTVQNKITKIGKPEQL